MPDLRPFRGWQYDFGRLGRPEDLLAPPYDVISRAEAEELRRGHPNHVAHLVLGLPPERGHHPDTVYQQAADAAARFKREAALVQDATPRFYRLTQEYEGPDGAIRRRHGLIGALRLHEFSEGVVLPHEETFAKPVEDRLRLMRATRMTFCQIFGLFDDASGAVRDVVEQAAGPMLWTMTDGQGAAHSFCAIEDADALLTIHRVLAPVHVFVADGHHRCTAALAYWRELGCPGVDDAERGAAAFATVCLSDMRDPGLGLFATHRLLRRPARICPDEAPPGVRVEALGGTATPEDLVRRVGECEGPAWAFVSAGGASLVRVTDPAKVDPLLDANRSPAWRSLDLAILHSVVLPSLLGPDRELASDEENLLFSRDAADAVGRARRGEVGIAILTKPPTLEQLRLVCEAGDRMPHKSTYFYPKVLSGAVSRDLIGGVPYP